MFPYRSRYDGYDPNFISERVLIAVGAALITVSPYLSWLHVVILGDFNLTALLTAGRWPVALAYAVSGVGVGLLLLAVLGRTIDTVRGVSLSVGAILLLVGGDATYGLVQAVSKSAGLGQVGVGPIMAVVGSILLIVPPIVGFNRRPVGMYAPAPAWRSPRWLPAAGGVVIALGLTWLPFHAGVGNYCGTPVGASFKSKAPAPSPTPPLSVQAQLSSDQAAVDSAQAKVNADQNGDNAATQQQSSAEALSNQAQQAGSNSLNIQDQVYQDQATVEGDQSTLSGDQLTVQSDQSTLSSDQSLLQTDQQQLASDQASGFDTSYDQTAISTQQQSIANDQATLTKDQQTEQADQAALNQVQAKLASDQKAQSAADANAANLDQQAQNASTSALNASMNAAATDSTDKEALSQAQSALQSDQDSWQNTYQEQLTAADNYNTALRDCQNQTESHYLAAAIIAALGGIISALLLFRRPRSTPPPVWPGTPPAY